MSGLPHWSYLGRGGATNGSSAFCPARWSVLSTEPSPHSLVSSIVPPYSRLAWRYIFGTQVDAKFAPKFARAFIPPPSSLPMFSNNWTMSLIPRRKVLSESWLKAELMGATAMVPTSSPLAQLLLMSIKAPRTVATGSMRAYDTRYPPPTPIVIGA